MVAADPHGVAVRCAVGYIFVPNCASRTGIVAVRCCEAFILLRLDFTDMRSSSLIKTSLTTHCLTFDRSDFVS